MNTKKTEDDGAFYGGMGSTTSQMAIGSSLLRAKDINFLTFTLGGYLSMHTINITLCRRTDRGNLV